MIASIVLANNKQIDSIHNHKILLMEDWNKMLTLLVNKVLEFMSHRKIEPVVRNENSTHCYILESGILVF